MAPKKKKSNSKTVAVLDSLQWLKDCENMKDPNGDPILHLEYQNEDVLLQTLRQFLVREIMRHTESTVPIVP